MRTLWHAGEYLGRYEFEVGNRGQILDPERYAAHMEAVQILALAYNAVFRGD